MSHEGAPPKRRAGRGAMAAGTPPRCRAQVPKPVGTIRPQNAESDSVWNKGFSQEENLAETWRSLEVSNAASFSVGTS